MTNVDEDMLDENADIVNAENEVMKRTVTLLENTAREIDRIFLETFDKHGLDGAFWGYEFELKFTLKCAGANKTIHITGGEEGLELEE